MCRSPRSCGWNTLFLLVSLHLQIEFSSAWKKERENPVLYVVPFISFSPELSEYLASLIAKKYVLILVLCAPVDLSVGDF